MLLRTFDSESLGYINLVEKVTHARVKDCYNGNELVFIVEEGQAGRAIGKDGTNIKRLSALLKKRIRIAEYNPDVAVFVNNLIYPVKGNIYKENGKIIIHGRGTRFKEAVLGKKRENLVHLQNIVSKYFDVVIEVKSITPR